MRYSEDDLKVGMKVRARLFGGVITIGTIEDTGEKNDMPLLDLDNGHWCYVNQVLEIVE